jgi:uncharacterized RDD family membrane protein YckC
MEWTDHIQIETPEQIDVSLELAGLGSRFVARLIDWLVKAAALMIIWFLGMLVLAMLFTVKDEFPKIVIVLLASVIWALATGYDVYFEVRHSGQTPGKRSAGIRVIRENGAPIDFGSSCVRNLLSIADFLPFGYLLGALLVVLSSRAQRLGDMAAGTLVVRERSPVAPADINEQITRLASSEIHFATSQLTNCGPEDKQILRSFLQRHEQMEVLARHNLACNLARRFVSKAGDSAVAPDDLRLGDSSWCVQFLASLYRDLAEREAT